MPIYTRTGDKGTTSLFGGKRISKSSLQVEAYGTIDEVTSFLGFVITKLTDKKEKLFLTNIQKTLYSIMALLSGFRQKMPDLEQEVTFFEQKIDQIQSKLPKLTRFILPQGNETSALFHILRAICRRAERSVIRANEKRKNNKGNLGIVKYLNRLSDLFFILARWHGRHKEVLL